MGDWCGQKRVKRELRRDEVKWCEWEELKWEDGDGRVKREAGDGGWRWRLEMEAGDGCWRWRDEDGGMKMEDGEGRMERGGWRWEVRNRVKE